MNNDDKDKNLSPEEIEVNNIIYEADLQIQEMENQIKNLPPDKGPSYELRPPGSAPTRPVGTRAQREQQLRMGIEKKVGETRERVEKTVENSGMETKGRVAEKADKWRNPDYREKRDEKNIDQSQSYLQRQMNRPKTDKEVDLKKEAFEAPAPDQSTEAQSKKMSMSAKFSMSYGYNNMQQKQEKTPEKSDKAQEKSFKDIEIDKDKD